MEKDCPKCKSRNIVEMMYGLMSVEACEDRGLSESFYGGCCEDDKTRPDYICLNCGYEWK